jgi:g-D-glutamyl-meso-diaminopimelate peptidase
MTFLTKESMQMKQQSLLVKPSFSLNIKRITIMVSFFIMTAFLLTSPIHATVNPRQVYTYEEMTRDIKLLQEQYPEAMSYHSIGKTDYGRDIWAVKIGRGETSILINSSHHAREWLTTNLVMEMLDIYLMFDQKNYQLEGRYVKDLFDRVSIWFIPMVNPDGVTLQQSGLSAFPTKDHQKLIQMNKGSRDFTRWKANAKGIDLNLQYPAEWPSIIHRVHVPQYKNYKGKAPLVTPETKALVAFTDEIKPALSLAYHSSGEIIFWHFKQSNKDTTRDEQFAKLTSQLTGYSLVKPRINPSGGGFTDWFIQKHKRPGLTIEISPYVGERHVPVSSFNKIWNENKSVPLALMDRLVKEMPVKVETINQPMTLFVQTALYTSPSAQSKTTTSLNPQSIHVTTKTGDFYRVKTWLGDRYIKPTRFIMGKREAVSSRYYVKETTKLFDHPFQKDSQLTISAPQHVFVKERLGDWYVVDTRLGLRWIKADNTLPYELEAIDTSLDLTEPTAFYHEIDRGLIGTISPQTVTATMKLGPYYKVKTYLGEKWIKFENN